MAAPWLAFYDEGVPHALAYPRVPLHRLLEESARRFPDRTAIKLVPDAGDETIAFALSYRQLVERVDRLAAALRALGVRTGERVALMLPNLPQFVISFYGALKAGAIVVNTNPTCTPREMQRQFADAGVETVVLLSGHCRRLDEVRERTPIARIIVADLPDCAPPSLRDRLERAARRQGLMADAPGGAGVHRFAGLLDAHPASPPEVEVAPDDIALCQYTGGTTGALRAAMLTHRNLVANTLQMRAWLAALEDGRETVLGALPLFHAYGMTVAMNVSIHLGATLVLVPDARDVEGVMRTIQREGATMVPGVPTTYIAMLQHPRVRAYDLRSVTACISGAAPLPMDVQVRFGEITGGRLVEGYGLTEASPVTHCNPIHGRRKAGSIGIPLPDVEARIVDPETRVEARVGEPGELWVRGPQVMAGYWQAAADTASALTEDGWLRTGDLARMDADGYFYIVDRLKDIIIASGLNIVPREVEEALCEHPAVLQAAVAGIPDPLRGETVAAYVVLKPGEAATAEEIIAFCAERLAPYKTPRLVEFRAALPMSTTGKVLRRALVEEEKAKLASPRTP